MVRYKAAVLIEFAAAKARGKCEAIERGKQVRYISRGRWRGLPGISRLYRMSGPFVEGLPYLPVYSRRILEYGWSAL